MHPGNRLTHSPPEVFTLIVDQLLPIFEDGRSADPLDFACLRLSSRGVQTLCDAAVRRLELRNCSGAQMQHLLQRFTGTSTLTHEYSITPACAITCNTEALLVAAMAHADQSSRSRPDCRRAAAKLHQLPSQAWRLWSWMRPAAWPPCPWRRYSHSPSCTACSCSACFTSALDMICLTRLFSASAQVHTRSHCMH